MNKTFVMALVAVVGLLGVLSLALCIYGARKWDAVDEENARDFAEFEAQRREVSVLDTELQDDLELLIAMQEGKARHDALYETRGITREALQKRTDEELLAVVAYELTPAHYSNTIEELNAAAPEDVLTAPAWHPLAGAVRLRRHDTFHHMIGSLPFNLGQLYSDELFASEPRPEACAPPFGDDGGEWAMYEEPCLRYVLNELSVLRFDAPLYLDAARLNPTVIDRLITLAMTPEPDTAMLDGKLTPRSLYADIATAAPDYISAYEELERYGADKALQAYRQALARDRSAMPAHYDSFVRRAKLESSERLVGFWLRRMDDGTALALYNAFKRAEERYGPTVAAP